MQASEPIAASYLQAVPNAVLWVLEQLHARQRRGWLVGGCVRDMLSGRVPSDWDVATNALPKEMLTIFPRVIPTGLAHGTVTILAEKLAIEVTTLRGEGDYKDGRRPENIVFLDDIEADLARRDFTFNAVAIDPINKTIVDPFGGREDLRAKRLRAVGEPWLRFTEDGLRIVRAARFAATLECTIEQETLAAMADPKVLETYSRVAAERIQTEWLKALRAPRPSIAFNHMLNTGMLHTHCPELHQLATTLGDSGHSLWQRNMATLDAAPPVEAVRLAALFRDAVTVGSGDKSSKLWLRLMRRLKFSNEHATQVGHILRHVAPPYVAAWSDADVRRWLRGINRPLFPHVADLLLAEYNILPEPRRGPAGLYPELVERCYQQLQAGHALQPSELAVNGKDLMTSLGLEPGRHLGELLNALLELVLEHPASNNRERLLSEARKRCAPAD